MVNSEEQAQEKRESNFKAALPASQPTSPCLDKYEVVQGR